MKPRRRNRSRLGASPPEPRRRTIFEETTFLLRVPHAAHYCPMRITLLLLPFVALFSISAGKSFGEPVRDRLYLVFVGTYTDKTSSKGIYAFDFDSATGKLIPRGLAAESVNPSWIVIHPDGKFAYAANESGKQSMISAFSIDAKAAK